MKLHTSPGPEETNVLGTPALRDAFLIGGLFQPGQLAAHYTDLDRMVIGAAVPLATTPLLLPAFPELGTSAFLERREIGIMNLGATGTVTVGAESFELRPLDCLYIGKGEREVTFASGGQGQAQFAFFSTPAHAKHPTAVARRAEEAPAIGETAKCNRRRINKYIHPDGIQSCQLVMGFTEFESGSVWNTMPPHTHSRRSEAYLYFDLGAEIVVHLLGEPNATRHLIVRDREVALSPSWSIHSGVGTGSYRFIWAMGGENQRFDDMDAVAASDLR